MSQQTTTSTEKFEVSNGHLADKVKELLHEGNVRRIIIKDSEGRTAMEVPVTLGVVGLFVAPTMAAVSALAALAADYSIEVERDVSASTDAGAPPPVERYRSLLEKYVELYNAGDLDGVMALYAEDSVQLMPDGIFNGRSAIRDRLSKELAAFSGLAHRYISYVEEGDTFADEWVFVGTHTGPVLLPDGTEVPPTGKRVQVQGMELVRVRDGKITVDNLYYDNMGVMAQLGLLPQQAHTTT